MSIRSRRNRRKGCAQRLTRPIVEILEPRLLLAVELFKDINPGIASSSPFKFASTGTTTYFVANDGVHGGELWRTDGTAAGTRLVKDLAPGHTFPSQFTNVNGTLFFQAEIQGSVQLWKSNGTPEGTQRVATAAGVIPRSKPMVNWNGKLFFTAESPKGVELWTSDGTDLGTVQVKDIFPGAGSSNPEWLTVADGSLYFVANDGVHGDELWKTNGTAEGTVMVKDLWPGITSSQPKNLVSHGGTLLWNANDGVQGLWRTDGTASGTMLLKQTFELSVSPAESLQNFAEIGNWLYFVGNDWTSGAELWKTDGTVAGTQQVKDIQPGLESSVPALLVNVNGTLFFRAALGASRGLWKSDGTAAGTQLVKDLPLPGGRDFVPMSLTNVNGVLYFVGFEGFDDGFNIWQSDGTTSGTMRFANVNSGHLANVNGSLFFNTSDTQNGGELWRVVEGKPSQAPSGTDRSITTLASAPYVLKMADFGFIDRFDTPPNRLHSVQIASLPAHGTLTFAGAAAFAGQRIAAADIAAGKLQLTPAGPATDLPTSFNFQVQDDGGTAASGSDLDPTPNTVTIQWVADGGGSDGTANHAPAGADMVVDGLKNAGYTFSTDDFAFSDALDTPANALAAIRLTTLPVEGTLLLADNAVTAGQRIPIAAVAAGQFRYAPPLNWSGFHATFTFQVQDNGGTAAAGLDLDPLPNLMSVRVIAPPPPTYFPNQPPRGADRTISLVEGSTHTFSEFDFGFTDDSDQPPDKLHRVFVWSLPVHGTLFNGDIPVPLGTSFSIADLWMRKVRYVAPAVEQGSLADSWTFRVQDNGGTFLGGIDIDLVPRTLSYQVKGVNRPPLGVNRSLEISPVTVYAFSPADFGFSDPHDEPANQFKAVEVFGANFGTLSLRGELLTSATTRIVPLAEVQAGNLRYTPRRHDQEKTESLRFRVQDDGGTVSGGSDWSDLNTLSLLVPVAPKNLWHNYYRPLDVNDDFSVTLADAQAIDDLLTRQGERPVPASGNEGPLFYDVNGDTRVTAADSAVIRAALALPNHAPQGISITLATGTPLGPRVISLDAFRHTDISDSDNRLAAVKFTTIPTRGQLTNNGVLLALGDFVSVADINAGKLRFTRPDDGGLPYVSLTFQVQDDGGTANGSVDLDPTPNVMNLTFSPVGGNPVNIFDVSGNAVVDDTDRVLAINMLHAFGPHPRNDYFDINGDGMYNMADYAIIHEHFWKFEDSPYGAPVAITVLQGEAGYTFGIDDFGFSDPLDSPPNNFAGITITALPPVGKLSVAGTPAAKGTFVTSADISAGKLSYVAPRDAAGEVGAFRFTLHDDGPTTYGRTASFPYSIALSVVPVNDAPTFEMDATINVTDESGPQALADLIRQVFPGPSDETEQRLHFTIDVTNASLFSAPPALDAAGKLTFTPALNASGQAEVTVTLHDDGGTANGGRDSSTPRNLVIHITKLRPLYNAVRSQDVDGDGNIAPGDVLEIINYVNARGALSDANAETLPPRYYDVNGDGFVAPGDALDVINYINAFGPKRSAIETAGGETADGEGEADSGANALASVAGDELVADLLSLLAADAAAERRRRQ